ncbi:MAG: hypothetical protein L6R41_008349 [Letrouitia leprolyta]|nr:MAG: hypothetical protein L6R41_008349 [Letrouitia leprolyta]
MPSLFCSIVTSVVAAILGLLSGPILHEHGLVPWLYTLPPPSPPPAFYVATATANDYFSFCSNGTWSPFQEDVNAPWMMRSTTSTPPLETPPPTNGESASSFFSSLFARWVYTVFVTEAVLFSRMSSFFQTNGPWPNTSPVVIKDSQGNLVEETKLLGRQQCNGKCIQWRSQRRARRHNHPNSNYVDKGIQVTRSLPTTPLPLPTNQSPPTSTMPTTSYADMATQTISPLADTPVPSPKKQWPRAHPSFQPEAAAFVPQIPAAKAPMSKDQYNQFISQHPMHGKRA